MNNGPILVGFVYRFIGLAADTKPTQNVADGTQFLEVDTSKTFVFYKGQWYEKTGS